MACWPASLAAAVAAAVTLAVPALAQQPGPTVGELVSAVVRIKAFINPDGRSVGNLGRERQGSGILIDDSGLILTIGYVMVEAHAAEVVTNEGRTVPATVVGYDHDTGFGLLRTMDALKLKPLPIGSAADLKEGDPVLVSGFGGLDMVSPVYVASRREFAGSWEYMVDRAIFTSPVYPSWSGAALITRDGKLAGVGSLIVGDAKGDHSGVPGNMFVPVDGLMPILGDLLANGRASGPGKPWLGIGTSELAGRLMVNRVTEASPAEKAGIRRGDVVVGIGGEATPTLAGFYRKLWSLGPAGVSVPLDVRQGGATRRIEVPSAHRLDHLRLKSTF